MNGNAMGLFHRILFSLCLACLACLAQPLLAQERAFNPGLLWRTGLAPQPSIPLPAGNRAWYVDANAPNGGDGSAGSPYNSFEVVVGQNVGDSYQAGQIRGGDHLYLTGEFKATAGKEKFIQIARYSQYGTITNPTLITTWPGKPRACFNGEGTKTFVILIRELGSAPGYGIRIESIEIKNANMEGIRTNDNRIDKFEIINCEIHHTNGSGIQGTGGGLTLWGNGLSYTVRNNLFYSNYENQIGGNAGAFTILSERASLEGTTVDVFDNIFYNEDVAIRHKHSGNITMNAHHNLIHSCNVNTFQYFAGAAFALRAFHDNNIYNNIIFNCLEFLFFDKENLQGDFAAKVANNTIINSGRIAYIHDGSVPQYRMQMNFSQNIYFSPLQPNVISLGNYSSTPYSIGDWSSAKNIFYHANASNFLINHGNAYGFPNAMTVLNDQGSISTNPLFANLDNNDFRLAAASPARGMGANGTDIGALPYGSNYVLNLNRYIVSPQNPFTLTAPNGGEAWRRGESHSITWSPGSITGNVALELVQNGTAVGVIAESVAASAGSYAWTVGRLANGTVISGTGCQIRIRATSGAASQQNMTF